ncbi:MAG: FG-GAP-like repeat-containing protein [Rubripirellula sp.]
MMMPPVAVWIRRPVIEIFIVTILPQRMHFPSGPYGISRETGRHPARRWFVGVLLGAVCTLVAGCGKNDQTARSGTSDSPAAVNQPGEVGGDVSASSLDEIQQLIAEGDGKQALSSVQRYLIRHPQDPQALVIAAQANHLLGDSDRSIELLEEASSLWPENRANLQARIANLLADEARWAEAIQRLQRVVHDDPEFDNARHSLAGILNLRGFRFDANQQVRELCRRGGASPEELRGLIWPSRTYVTFAEKPDVESADKLQSIGVLSAARALYGQGDLRDALRVLRESELVRRKDPCAYALYGQVMIESQGFEDFPAWYEGAPDECQAYPSYWMAMGGWALHLGENDLAVRMFGEAVLREPGDAAGLNRLTQALDAVGEIKVADSLRQRSEQINQITQIAKVVLASPDVGPQSISELSNRLAVAGRPLEALAWHRIALQRAGGDPNAMQSLAVQQARVVKAEQQNAEHLQSVLLQGLDLAQYPLDESRLARAVDSNPSLARSSQPRREEAEIIALQPRFTNVASQAKLEFQYANAPVPVEREFRIFQAYGGGVACLDFDLDGCIDFYFGQASGEPPDEEGTRPNQLARNLGRQFVNVTAESETDDRSYTCGVTSGDWNQDGWPDLLIGNMQRNRLLINQGDGTFRLQSGDGEWQQARYTTGVAIADVDGDNLPDIVEVNYLEDQRMFDPIERKPDGTPVRLPGPLHFTSAGDRLFRSQGDGTMQGSPLGDPSDDRRATGLGLLITNIDDRPGNELFVANDLMANRLWSRDGAGTQSSWKDVAVIRGVAYGANGMPLACMGIAAADFDENGRLDLHITNFEDQWSNQYMQREDGGFTDLTLPLGLDRDSLKMLGFGTQALDYDLNSTVDLVVGNGHVEDYRSRGSQFEMPTQVFAWEQRGFRLMEVAGDPSYWSQGHLSRAMAKCDWNRDGRVDLIVTDLRQPVALLENRTRTSNHWLQLELAGTNAERDAIGSVVEIHIGDRVFRQSVQTGDGYMSKNQFVLTFGLGAYESVDELVIRWPDGDEARLEELAADRCWLIVQGQAEAFQRE